MQVVSFIEPPQTDVIEAILSRHQIGALVGAASSTLWWEAWHGGILIGMVVWDLHPRLSPSVPSALKNRIFKTSGSSGGWFGQITRL